MKFEKVDLFCPKCGKYSVYADITFSTCHYGCSSCLSNFIYSKWIEKMKKGFENEVDNYQIKGHCKSLKESLAIKQSIDDYLMANYTGHWINSKDLKNRLGVAKWELNKEEKEMTVDQFAEKYLMGKYFK